MKNWRDLFYFSKGERLALSLLLILITIAFILLLLVDDKKEEETASEPQYIVNPTNAPRQTVIDSTQTISPNKKEIITNRKKTSFGTNKKRSFKKNNGRTYIKTEKYPPGTIVELNTADTLILKKVPGIGSVFARRIIKYRDLLGGFYTVEQLKEIYGMDKERYEILKNWFHTDTSFIAKLPVNHLSYEQLLRHPYLNKEQTNIICQLRKQKRKLTGWEDLYLLDEFTETDKQRLKIYFRF
ncbi:MAG: helix-hairpin-helix domain-containing protein [Tannerellaceae bacterium]|jgi:competence ComEA-like helix-hairpin-helix protein|nr:helix-hairpin-helix domain-containing protein [Tannerellaceae bacterium]